MFSICTEHLIPEEHEIVRRIAEEYELVKWQHFERSDPWLKIS